MTTAAHLLAAYDAQLRRRAEVHDADTVTELGPLLLATFGGDGFVTYRSLRESTESTESTEPDVDGLVDAVIGHFRDHTTVDEFEWKTRGHDWPADLGDRLVERGLVAEPLETVMVGEAAALAASVDVPGVTVRRVGEGRAGTDPHADLAAMLALHDDVFGPEHSHSMDTAVGWLESADTEIWLAEVDGRVVCAGRLAVVPGTEFAGIWGGGTLPAYRGRGIYRAVVAARARAALARGVRYLHSDSTDMSRPILERSGLVAVTTTTPYIWTR